MFKFIHAADIHLDSPLRGLEQYEGAPVEAIRQASRRALEKLVDLAIEEQVAFVLIAGDLYDGDWRDFSTGLFFVRQASRLREAGIRLFVIAGNHDAKNSMTRSLRLPENVSYLRADTAESVAFDDVGVIVHGQSFATAAVQEDLSSAYPAAQRGLFNIGILHTCATGSEEHARYAPCTLDGLRSKDYDYWALGHVHQRQTLSDEPHIIFSGNIQGRHIRESGPKGCYLVTVQNGRAETPEFRPLDVLRWARLDVDVTSAVDGDEALQIVSRELDGLVASAGGLPHAVRVSLTGATPAHEKLSSGRDQFVHEVRSLALDAGSGDLWIEKVKIHTRPATSPTNESEWRDGALGELFAVFDELPSAPHDLSEFAGLSDILNKLPPELKNALPLDNAEWLSEVLEGARAHLKHQLQLPADNR